MANVSSSLPPNDMSTTSSETDRTLTDSVAAAQNHNAAAPSSGSGSAAGHATHGIAAPITTHAHPALHPHIAKHVPAAAATDEYYNTDEAQREIRDWGGDAPTDLPAIIPKRKRGLSSAAPGSGGGGGGGALAGVNAPHQAPVYTKPTGEVVDARAGAPIRKRTRSGTVWSEGGYPELTHVDTAFSDAHRAFSRLSRQRECDQP